MSVDLEEISIVHWFPNLEKHRCGYCKNPLGSVSYGMWAETLTVEDYQDLIDRGWRRSGKYCYKPIMNETCCPQYTIRCEALKLTLSKSQKKVIKKVNKFLGDGIINKQDLPPEAQFIEREEMIIKEGPTQLFDKSKLQNNGVKFVSLDDTNEKERQPRAVNSCGDNSSNNIICDRESTKTVIPPKQMKTKGNFKEGIGADPNKPPCKKAKLLRLEKKKEKMLHKGMSLEKLDCGNQQKSLEEFLGQIPNSIKHKLKIKLVRTSPAGLDWESTKEAEYVLYRKYQMSVHNDPPDKCSMGGFIRFLVSSPLKITTERMFHKHKHFEVSAKLYAKYQMSIHGDPPDECDTESYYRFLVETPLKHVQFQYGADGPGFGSFHQQYWLDDKLIAVGVIDVLPKCVSSVYFFYDPDYRSLTLGTYGALRELHFTRELHEKVPAIQYYYMGFYIHSCPKMLYKGKYSPSFLLCPETYHWFPLEQCIQKLDENKYSRLNDDDRAKDDQACTKKNIDEIKMLHNYNIMHFKYYKHQVSEQDVFNNIGKLIGNKCCNRLLFIVNH